MQNEKKKPSKKLFLILGCIALAIALTLSLVMCKKPDEPIGAEPVTPTQPSVADTQATTRLKAPEGVLVEGLREQYEIGDEVAFTVTVEDDYYALTKVKINSKKVEPDADGYYRTKATHPLDIVIEKELVYGDAVIAIEEENEHITYEGVTLKLALQSLDGNEEGQAITVEAMVKDGKIAFQKLPVGLWNIEPIYSLGGQIHFSPVVIAERHNEMTTKRAVGINDSIKSGSVYVNVHSSSVSIQNCTSDKSGVILLQGQELSGSIWFGMKVQLSAEDLNATDYRNIGLNIYKNGSNRIQILSLGNGRAAVKYDNDHVKELSSGLVEALENGQLLLAVHRTSGGGLEVYAGAYADEMTKMFTVSSIKAGSGKLDQFGLDMKGPLKHASLVDLQTGSTMANVLPSQSSATQDVTICIKSTSSSLNFDGLALTFTSNRDQNVQFTGTVVGGKVELQDVPVGTYTVSAVNLFGGKLTFEDAVILHKVRQTTIGHTKGINDSLRSDAVVVDVSASNVNVEAHTGTEGGVILLQGQELSGNVWFGMKVQLSAEDLKATDYRNIGLNIYKNGPNRIQILSLGNGRAAIKYDDAHVKELSSGLVKALESGQLLLAVNRTAEGKLEVYVGIHAGEMEKLFTVDSSNMGADIMDQFGLDMHGPLKKASLKNINSGDSIDAVLPVAAQTKQDITIRVTSTSSSLNFDGLTLTLTSNRDHNVQFTGTVVGGKMELQDVPVGTYAVSAVNLFGGKLTFEDAVVLAGLDEVELCHNVGINDTVKNGAVVVDVANAGIRVKDYTVNSSKNILLKGQSLSGNIWFGMKVQLSAEDLNATDYRNIGLNIYKNGSNRIQVVSLGSGRAAVKYDTGHVKELRSDQVKALEAGKLLLAVNRTAEGKLEVYAGIHTGEMEKLFTVDSPNMGADTLDQFGLDVQGPIEEAALENLVSGDRMASVLTDAEAQTVTVQLKSKSGHMSLAGVELTFTLKRDASVKFTAAADQAGKLVLTDAPVGTYAISALDFFGGKLTFADLTLWEGRTAVELTHKEGINDQVGSAGAQVNAATSSVIFKDSVATTNRKDGYFFLQGQKLTGNVWFGMKVKMDAAALNGNGANFIALCIYEGGWNLIQVAGNGTVQYNYNYAAELPAEIRNALTGDGMLLAVNRAADGTLRVYGGATADRMLQLIEITDTSDPKSNMGAADLDQFGFMTQGSIPGASIENLTSGISAEDIFSGFALAREDVTFTVQKKNGASVMSFAGVEFTLTLKDDAAVKYTGTVDSDGKLVLQDMPMGTYQVSAVSFLGRELTFSDVQIQLGDTQKVLNYTQGINDNVNNASVTVDVKNSSFHITDMTGNGYFFLQSQNLTGDVWFGMKVQISAEDLAAADYRNIGLQTYGTGGADYVQILNNHGGGVLIKYDNSNYCKLSDELVTALNSGDLHLLICRTAAGKLEVYAGTAANKMIKLFVVASPKIRTNAIGQFGVNINGPFVNAGIQDLAYGATAEAAMPGFAYAPVDVTVSIKAKSSRMTFEGVKLNFTLKSDPSITYTGTADANGMITVNGMLPGTYGVSDVDFLGGKLTFPNIVVGSGSAVVEITHNEGIQDGITSDASKVSVSVATSSVYFSNYTASGRSNGVFYLKDQTLTGDVWFGMRMKVSAADWTEADGYPYIAWNSYAGNNWNFVQMMNNNGNGIGAIKYNNGYTTGLNAALAANLTGDGLLMLLNRTSSGTMDVYLGTGADDMMKMFTVNAAASSGKPALNMGTNTLDNFGFLIEGKIGSASIENMVSGTSMDDVLEKFQ